MSVVKWIGRRFGLRDTAPWVALAGGESHAGKRVSEQTALQLSAVWACVRILSETIASLPLHVYRVNGNGAAERDDNHELARLLRAPHAELTPMEFWESQIAAILLRGNSVSEKIYGTSGRLIALEPLDLSKTSVSLEDGQLVFTESTASGVRRLERDDVFMIRGRYLGGRLGVSVIQYGRHTMGGAIAADETAGKFFANGLRQTGFVKMPGKVKDEAQADMIKKLFLDPLKGSGNAGKIGLLEAGMEWVQASLPPEDAELLATRRFNVEEICRWFGVPPMLAGHAAQGQTMWGSGVEQINIGFVIHSLRPHLNRIESAINHRLIKSGERGRVFVKFAVMELLRGDSKTRAEFLSKMVQNGLMTRNEGRAFEDLPPVAGGDELTAQINLAPVSMLGTFGKVSDGGKNGSDE